MHTLKKSSSFNKLIVAASLAFFLFGFSDILKGSAVAEMIESFGASYTLGGAILGCTYAGFFTGTLSSVRLLRKYPVAKLLIAAIIFTTGGIFLFGCAATTAGIFIATFITGLGCGLIDVTANLVVRMATSENHMGRALNQLSFFHGFGAIVSPLFASIIMRFYADWHFMYRFAFLLLMVLMVWIIRNVMKSDFAFRMIYEPTETKKPWEPQAFILSGFLFWYMTIEAGISGWLVAYARQTIGLPQAIASTYLSLFFIMLTLGRLISSHYVDRLGLLRAITLNVSVVFILISSAIVFPNMHIALPLTGLCMAPLFPTTVAILVQTLGASQLQTTGIFFSIAGLGGVIGPWIIGLVARNYSLRAGISLLSVFSICFLGMILIYSIERRRKLA